MQPTITYIDFAGEQRQVKADVGDTLMTTAVQNDVPGIEGDCGGNCACATCHLYVEQDWMEKLGERTETEIEMLEVVDDYADNSRLGCQVEVTEAMDGLVVRTPESQY